MPDYPYSDNLYSGLEDSDVEEHTPEHGQGYGSGLATVGDGDEYHHDQRDDDEVLSPTDGYFGRSGSGPPATSSAYPGDPYSPSSQDQDARIDAGGAGGGGTSPLTSGYAVAAAFSSQVPHVPDVWVSDPTIEQGSTAESKAREAQEERELNSRHRGGRIVTNPSGRTFASHAGAGGGSSISSPSHPSLQSSASSGSGHPRYGYGPGLRYTPPSSTALLSRPQRSGTTYSERSSLFSEAPPAYTPSPTSPASVASNNYQTFSPSSMGRATSDPESQGLLAGHRQYRSLQDMGGDPAGDGYSTVSRAGAWRDRARRCVPHFTGRTCRMIVLGLVLLFVAVGFLVSSFVSVEDEKKTHIPGGGGSGHDGSGKSPIGKMPIQDGHGIRLAYPAFDGEMPWAEGRLCDSNQTIYPTQTFNLDFSDAHSLSFVQDMKKNNAQNGQEVHVSGDVVVRRSGRGTPGPSITLEVVSNDDQIQLDIDWDHAEQELQIRTPPSVPWPRNGGTLPCLQIRATIWAPAGSALNSLSIEAVHLGVQLLDNLSLRVAGPARISSTVGPVVAATDGEKDAGQLMHGGAPASFGLDSRRIEVRTVSSPIAGSWPLYDYLGLQTMSGPVRAGVQPKAALRGDPRPAVLYVHTTSGSVEVHEPVAEAAGAAAASWALQTARTVGPALAARLSETIPPRRYEVDLHTMSGTVRGSLAFGTSCKVHTTSGNIDLTLLPVLDRSQAATALASGGGGGGGSSSSALETATTSGTTVIRVLDALWRHVQTESYEAPAPLRRRGQQQQQQQQDEEEEEEEGSISSSSTPAIRVLDSRHATTSASIRLSYPPSWEGSIEADTLTGGLDVSGRGVEIIRREEGFPGYKKHVLARKGRDGAGGSLVCNTMSGSITVEVGS